MEHSNRDKELDNASDPSTACTAAAAVAAAAVASTATKARAVADARTETSLAASFQRDVSTGAAATGVRGAPKPPTPTTQKTLLTSGRGGACETPWRAPPSSRLLKPQSPKVRSRSHSPSPSRRGRRFTSNSNGVCKINVGPNYQVPSLPPFFLTTEGTAPTTLSPGDFEDSSGGLEAEWPHTPMLVYSACTLVRVAAARAAETAAAAASEGGTPAAAIAEDVESLSYVRSEEDLDRYLTHAAASWGPPAGASSSGWPPFSPEFALQLLHAADYNPERALKLLRQPGFSLLGVCHAPLRRYDNKWRPKDRRGHLPGAPYPPAHTLKTYTHRWHRHNQQSQREGGWRGAG